MGQSAVIIGASSGIGAGLAKCLAQQGYALGFVARRDENLRILAASLLTTTFTRVADIADCRSAMEIPGDLLQDRGGVDLVGISSIAGIRADGLFWIAPVDVACEQILRAIRRRQKHAYVTKRWRLIAWLLRLLPEWAYHRR